MTFRPGDYRVICDHSGFTVWASDTVKLWNGMRVAKRFAGDEVQRHPQDFVRGRVDDQRVPDARPRPDDVFLSPGDVLASSL
jgi:hypothetical protein